MEKKTLNDIENIKIEDAVGDAVGAVTGAVAGAVGALLDKRDDIKADLEEIKTKIVARLAGAGDLTQDKYEAVVEAVIGESATTKQITADEASELKAELQGGYEAIRQTVHEHTAAGESTTTA
ncbi:MAG: hypothetical protein KKI08_20385 [Armatimonadetes bacterium]|nr:hypothetical protein [Armatimonadota bacterium]